MVLQPIPTPPPESAKVDFGRVASEALAQTRTALQARHAAGASGREIVRAYTMAMDRVLCMLFAASGHEYFAHYPRLRHRCAVVAQGGYGRRELSPGSDIDLVFLYSWKATPFVETVAEKILYTLWDTGLVVGHALRNPRACVRLAARDVTVKTALLDARYICGDLGVFMDLREAVRAELLSKDGTRFLREKLEEQAARHRRYGDSVYLLQPHIKEGEGGLRDIHAALWMAKVKFKVRRLRDLVSLGIVTERELAELETSQDFLWRVRNALHFLTGTHQDQLRFEYQEDIAAQFVGSTCPAEKAVEHFMRLYYLHAAAVNRCSDVVIGRCLERARISAPRRESVRTVQEGMQIRGDVLTVTGPRVFRQRPANLLRVFREAQRHHVGLSSITKRGIREHLHLIDEGFQQDPEAVAEFLAILRGRHRVYATLREMHKHEVLIRFIPEFAGLLCLVQRDLYHIYTVDEHSLRGILELERLREGEYARACPVLTQAMREDDRTEVLLLAMLFHDIGKGHGHAHAERGAELAGTIGERLGLNADDVTQLRFLVRHHLLMSHLAQRRDIRDEDLVLEFARQVGDESTLRKLYLLTFADMKAVGPNFWNNWRGLLLGELYMRAQQLLEHNLVVDEDRGARVARVKERVRASISIAGMEPGVDEFLASLPDSYFLTTPEESMPGHAVLAARFRRRAAEGPMRERAAVEIMLRHFPEWDFSELVVCTADRPGLFSTLAGVLAAAGLSVLSARIATGHDGMVLDQFRISHGTAGEGVGEENRWDGVRQTLESALRGAVDVERLVQEWRRPRRLPPPRKGLPEPVTKVVVDNEVSREYTVLDVYTRDRVGVLFTITRALYRLGLRVHVATITTTLEQVVDVFYVTDRAGQKLQDPDRLHRIQTALMACLHQDMTDVPGPASATGGAPQWAK